MSACEFKRVISRMIIRLREISLAMEIRDVAKPRLLGPTHSHRLITAAIFNNEYPNGATLAIVNANPSTVRANINENVTLTVANVPNTIKNLVFRLLNIKAAKGSVTPYTPICTKISHRKSRVENGVILSSYQRRLAT